MAASIFMKPKTEETEGTIVVLETSLGDIEVELNAEKAPVTVENFLTYVNAGWYDGLCFHRVMLGFVVQGGGFEPDGTFKNTMEPIKIESNNGLSNLNGTIAMARSTEPDSATSQFYINIADNTALDYVDEENPGYTVFGEVISGMDVVMDIARAETGLHEVYYEDFDYTGTVEDWPVEDILIIRAYVKE
ncbi:MAG TPA: peptidyl-prolyl cis-trans isomerase [Candidatus Bathyarchaeota archaeon]|nr:peptidyl-prolyl cis-trans isomerase [Candidatus Bathyarchaeota archaeon]